MVNTCENIMLLNYVDSDNSLYSVMCSNSTVPIA